MTKSMMRARKSDLMASISWPSVSTKSARWAGGRVFLLFHRGAVECLDEYSCRDKSSFGTEFGEDVYGDVIVPRDIGNSRL
jgi:hypothetical protein